MCFEAAALKVESDSQLNRLESYFDWALSKYPLVDNKENESPEELSYKRRFISTPPIRLRPANPNSIMSTHLPWQFDEGTGATNPLLGSSKKVNQSLVGTPNRKQNTSLNNSMQGRSNAAMSMLNFVRDRCTTRTRPDPAAKINSPASLQKTINNHRNFASPTTSINSKATTSSSTSTFYPGLGTSHVFTKQLFETSTTLSPDTIILRQRCETNSVIHLQSPAARSDFLRTSPSGRFIMTDSNPSPSLSGLMSTAIDEPSDNTTICNTPMLSHSDRTIMAMGSTSDDASCSLDGSGANATARKIVFSPEAIVRMKIGDAEEALFNVSDSVLLDVSL